MVAGARVAFSTRSAETACSILGKDEGSGRNLTSSVFMSLFNRFVGRGDSEKEDGEPDAEAESGISGGAIRGRRESGSAKGGCDKESGACAGEERCDFDVGEGACA